VVRLQSAEASESDYYVILGVEPTADRDELHAAYRRLARTAHPDVSGDEIAMKRLNAAWAVLRDPWRRAAYDADRPARQAVAAARVPASGPPAMPYGRYEGLPLVDIARLDRPFLEWLRQAPGGRHLRRDIDAALAEVDNWRPTLGGRSFVRSAL
jgi:curved DNA-binding protein CbpA